MIDGATAVETAAGFLPSGGSNEYSGGAVERAEKLYGGGGRAERSDGCGGARRRIEEGALRPSKGKGYYNSRFPALLVFHGNPFPFPVFLISFFFLLCFPNLSTATDVVLRNG